ncbi:hypothetical protein IFM58399_09437 [Aspergillus lentulus]|uniref:putative extracellular glycine/serine-rich protein n=1 Tax=Aspergillus lentulus TaxID=293939 RepID=UPI001395030B|nr:uncharacterized protein IFM58399_09437 [Aspergillus lentulus]GFF52875.1 hypothetical protein IFM58399_09437 [Aspergillus lentulus]GFF81577.1 hypothetical protein IFM47457_05517 [Aspergillus lentulus]
MATLRKAKASLLALIFLVDMVSFSGLAGARPIAMDQLDVEGYHGRLGQEGAADLAEELDWHKAPGVDSSTHIQSRQYSGFDSTATGDMTAGNAAAGNGQPQPGGTTTGNTWAGISFAGTVPSGIAVTPSGGDDKGTAASPWSPGSSAPGTEASGSATAGSRPGSGSKGGGAPTTTSASSGTPASWGGSGGSSSASASPGTKASGPGVSGNADEASDTGTRPNSSGFSPSSSGSSAAMAGFGQGSGDAASKGSETVSSALDASGTGGPRMPAPSMGSSASADGTLGSRGSEFAKDNTGYGNDTPSTLANGARASTPNEPAESGTATKGSEAVDSTLGRASASMEAPDSASTKASERTKRSTETDPVNGGGNTSNGVNGGATNTGGGTNVNVITSPANGGDRDKGALNTLLDKVTSIIKSLR